MKEPTLKAKLYRATLNADKEIYDGDYRVSPKREEQILKTTDKFLEEDITVLEIPSCKVDNDAGGSTYIIAKN